MNLQPSPAQNDTSNTASWAWVEWVGLMGYAGIVALTVSCALGVAVVLVGS
jgi:hypothetical protein